MGWASRGRSHNESLLLTGVRSIPRQQRRLWMSPHSHQGAEDVNGDVWMCTYATANHTCEWLRTSGTGDVPAPRYHHSATMLIVQEGSAMVVFGGLVSAGDASSETLSFDVSSGRWTSLRAVSQTPPARWGHTATALGPDRLLITGGFTQTAVLDDMWIFSVAALEWSQIAQVQSPDQLQRGEHTSICHDGDCVSYGGTSLDLKNIENDDIAFVRPGCNKGYMSPDFASTPCVACPRGFFSSETGATNCKQCPSNITTPKEASTSEKDCSLCDGNVCHGGVCTVVSSTKGGDARPEVNCQCSFFYSKSDRCDVLDWWWIAVPAVFVCVGAAR